MYDWCSLYVYVRYLCVYADGKKKEMCMSSYDLEDVEI